MAPTSEHPARIVVFLLDVSRAQSVHLDSRDVTTPSPEHHAEKLASAVERLLHYHSSCAYCDLQWSFQFFDSDSCFLSLKSRTIPLRSASPDAIEAFRHQLSRRVSEASVGSTRPYKEKYAAIARALQDALRDIDWVPKIDALSLDPLLGDDHDQKEMQPLPCNGAHPVTPLLYLFSAAPDSIPALNACDGASAFLHSTINGRTPEGPQPHDSERPAGDVHSPVVGRRDARVKDEFIRTVRALINRNIGLVWVDSKPSLIGMKSSERSRVISAFSRWLPSQAPQTNVLDISSLLLDSRILSPTAVISRVDTDSPQNTRDQGAPITANKSQDLKWCVADIVLKHPPHISSPGKTSKHDLRSSSQNAPKSAIMSHDGEAKSTPFRRYFRAQLSSSFEGCSRSVKPIDQSKADCAPSDHIAFILRGITAHNITDETLFSMGAFASSGQVLRPVGHGDPLSDSVDVAGWASLFAGLMTTLAHTRRDLVADVCVRSPEGSGCVRTLHSVLIRPITALSASVRKVNLHLEVSKMRPTDSAGSISLFSEKPGSLLIPDLPCVGISEKMPEDRFDHCLAGCQRKTTLEAQGEDLEMTLPIRHCLRAFTSGTDGTESPPHCTGLEKTRHNTPMPATESCDSGQATGSCPRIDRPITTQHSQGDEMLCAPESHVDPIKEQSVQQCRGAETCKARPVRQELRLNYKPTSTLVFNKEFDPDKYHDCTLPIHTSSMDSDHAHEVPQRIEPVPMAPGKSAAQTENQRRSACCVSAHRKAAEEANLIELATTAPQGLVRDPSTPTASLHLYNKLLSPVTERPERRISNAERQVGSERETIDVAIQLGMTTGRFTSDVAKLTVPNNDAGEHVRDSLLDLAAIASVLSDDRYFKGLHKGIINMHLRKDSDVFSDLESARKEFMAVQKSSSTFTTIPSTVWPPILVAFEQIVWQIAEYASADGGGTKRQHRPHRLRRFVERSLSILSRTQMIGEATTSLPQVHALFQEAFSSFFNRVLNQFLKGTGSPIFSKLVKRIFIELDQDMPKASPCVSAESVGHEQTSPVESGDRHIRHDDAPNTRQSSYKQLEQRNAMNEQGVQDHHQERISRSSSRSYQALPDGRMAGQSTDGLRLKKNVRRTLYFDSERSGEKRMVKDSPNIEPVVKRQKTNSSMDHKTTVAEARKRKPMASSTRRLQLSTKSVAPLQTVRQRRVLDGSNEKVASRPARRQDPGQDLRSNKVIAVSVGARLRRSPRNKKGSVVESKALTQAKKQNDAIRKSHSSPRRDRHSKICVSVPHLDPAKISSDGIVPATPIRKMTSQSAATLDSPETNDRRVTRSAAKLAEIAKQGGIPQSPG